MAADGFATHAPAPVALGCAAVAVVASAWGLAVTGGVPVGGLVAAALGVALGVLVRRVPRRAAAVAVGVLGAAGCAVWAPGLAASSGALAVWPVLGLALAVLQFATARSLREVRLVLGLSVLVVLAAAGVSPVAALVGPLVLVWGSVLAGFAGAVPHRGAGAGPRGRTVRAVVAAGTAGVVLFLLVPPTGGAALAGGALGRAAAGGEAAAAAAPRSSAAYAGGELDLSSRGDLPETELLSVPAGSPSWWRSGVLDTYDGRTWSASAATATWSAVTEGWAAGAEDGASPVRRVDEVRPLSAEYPALVSAGSPVGVSPRAGGARLRVLGTSVLLTPPGAGYAVTSRQTPTVGDAVVPGTAGPAPADAGRWLQVPTSVPQRVRDLGRELAGGAGGGAAAVALVVEEHLRSVARYSLDAPVPGAGEDAVDAFLFVDRVGFCEQFASAEVVLLRSAGIPARLVTGFAAGTEVDGRRVLRGVDAHAWVEVWVPGQGWTTSDPTAGAVPVAGSRSPWWAGAWSWAQRAVGAVLDGTGSRVVAAAVLAGVVVGGCLVLRARRGTGAPARAAVPPVGARRRGDASLVALLVALDRFDAALPPDRRRGPAEGLSAWRARLGAAGSRGVPAEALGVVERACFARALPARAELDGAREALERAASRVLGEAGAAGPAGGRR
ncbi:transglutaminase-like putative cysteine protease [Kineococcus radiotolerans]|uniref:Transglutaminase-like putative cysteine protease n=1 Tax=Kineococcus radiotolerans TaxID=131568 RepID=A0A7W4TIL7_KINRA|nr:transglutaminase-like domain-containing protein [Kineococcus radiotolerans]MBB2899619.1 transglutaminase-like putative cysteine protease [Kineococcus radiotolerans]